jgi:hypothetical protein
MKIDNFSGWHRVSVTPGLVFQGERFYIAFRTPASQDMLLPLKAGASGKAYGLSGTSWLGPQTMRMGYRIYADDPSYWGSYGQPCRTSLSSGRGTISYQAGINAEAGLQRQQFWANQGRIALPLVPNRDGRILALSFLASSASGKVTIPIEIYKKDLSSNQPGALVRRGSLSVDTIPSWRHVPLDPLSLAWQDTYFVALVTGGQGVSIEAEHGKELRPHVMAPGSSSWAPFSTTMRPAMRVHMDPADSENLFAVGSPVRAAAPSTSYLLRRQAHSDMWVSGFSLRAQVSGQSQSILCEMRLANKDGTPRSYKERQSAIWMSTRLDWYETGFAPVFVPKGAIYFVGYRSPDPSTGQILVEPAGTPFGSSHFSKGPNQTTWVGPSGAPQHAFAVNSACATRNDALTDQFRKSWAADTEHAIADTAPSDMWVHGFSIWARHSLPGQRMLGRLYADASGKPGQLLRERSVEMQSSTDWHRVHFDWPVFLRKGQAYHLAIVTPSGSGLSDVELIVGSVYHEEHSRPASGGVWQAQGRKPFSFKLHGGMGAQFLRANEEIDVGKSLELELTGATPFKICGTVLGFSDWNWGSIPLPLALPMWPECSLQVSYDMLLAVSGSSAQGVSHVSMPIPNDPSFIRLDLYLQTWTLESASNPFELSWSNPIRVRIGD